VFVAFLLVSIEAVDEVFTPTPNFPRSPKEFLIKACAQIRFGEQAFSFERSIGEVWS
jgi:hypothetical protein